MSYMDSNLYTRYQLLEGKAADKAKQLGLKYAGWGKWSNKSGKVVAMTKKDKLVPISGTYITKGKLGTKPDKKPIKKKAVSKNTDDMDKAYQSIKQVITNAKWMGNETDADNIAKKLVASLKKSKGPVSQYDLATMIYSKDYVNLSIAARKIVDKIYTSLPSNLVTKKTTDLPKQKPKIQKHYQNLIKTIHPIFNNNTHALNAVGNLLLLKDKYDDALSIEDVYGSIFGGFYHNASPEYKKVAQQALNILELLSDNDALALLDAHGLKGFGSETKSSKSTHKFADITLIKGEIVKRTTDHGVYDNMISKKDMQINEKFQVEMKQDALLKAKTWRSHIPLAQFKVLTEYANEWQADSQYHHSMEKKKRRNKFLNDIMSGKNPAIISTDKPIYRGLTLSVDKAEQFLRSIKVGKTLRLPPSGFTASAPIARDFATGETGVLFKLSPSKKGEIHGMHLAYQRDAQPAELAKLKLPYNKVIKSPPKIEDFPDILLGKQEKLFNDAKYMYDVLGHWTYPDVSEFMLALDYTPPYSNYNHEQEIITNGNALTKVNKVTKLYSDNKVCYIIELENLGILKSKPAAVIRDNVEK